MGDDGPRNPAEAAALADLVFALTAPHTLEEIADHLGLSRFAVARIERRALGKIRAGMSEGWEDSALGEPSKLHLGVDRVCPGDGRVWWGEED
jgi:hypothetical protein